MTPPIQTGAEMQGWLVALLARHLGLEAAAIDAAERFSQYGLDSNRATALVAVLGAGRSADQPLHDG